MSLFSKYLLTAANRQEKRKQFLVKLHRLERWSWQHIEQGSMARQTSLVASYLFIVYIGLLHGAVRADA